MVERIEADLVIVGGGPAGMSAAVAAYDAGLRSILVLERDGALGGILRQCIHNGFGLHRFKEELTGPEYANRYVEMVKERGIAFKLNTMVLDIDDQKCITATNSTDGIFTVQAKAIILAMGCRERPKGALNISGMRPSGIFTAGTAQRFVNMDGYMPGNKVVILGSGDIGLIMARRMTLEGAKVEAVCELMPYSGGLARNIQQCLNDFDIPLLLSHTVVEVHGKQRVTGVTIARVDENRKPIQGSEKYIECDTLLLSVGLLPENELTKSARIPLDRITGGAIVDQSRQTEIPGIFACGNVLHVHDLVDYVSEEAAVAGRAAYDYLRSSSSEVIDIKLSAGHGVRYTVPQRITRCEDVTVYFRVSDVFKDKCITIKDAYCVVYSKKKQKFAPGEMEAVVLKAGKLKGLDGRTLTVCLE